MQALAPDYLAEIARQIGFISAFLGGVAATFMIGLLSLRAPGRIGAWSIACSAAASVAFIVAVVASTSLLNVLHPHAPASVKASTNIDQARLLTFLPFMLGMYLLLACLGLAGWLHSRRIGLATALIAGAGAVLVTITL